MRKQNTLRKEFRRFKEKEFYNDSHKYSFKLLPFNFRRLNSQRELLINFVGDFLIVPNGTVKKIIQKDSRILNQDIYLDLLANNFIHDSNELKNLDLLSNRYRSKKTQALSFASLHIFVITLRCEHTCKYCQVSRVSENKLKYDFDRENLIKAIHLMLSSPQNDLTMEFQGGESLLAFDKIQFAYNYTKKLASKKGKNITYVICTNLAPINQEVLNFCKENNILISASLDGPKEIHNKNRIKKERNSYELTIKGINLTKKILGEDYISVLMTTTKLSLKYPIEIINEYRSNGFKSIFLRPISPYGFAIHNKDSKYLTEEFLDFYKKGLDYIIDLNKKGEHFTEIYTSVLLKKMLTSYTENYVDLMSPSGLINSVIVYDYNGDVYVSDEARMLAQMKDETFKLGTVHDTWEDLLNNSVIDNIAESGINDYLAGCESCAYNIYCGADPVHNYATQKDMYGYRPDNAFCKRNMNVMDIIFNKIDEDETVIDIFQNWIRNA